MNQLRILFCLRVQSYFCFLQSAGRECPAYPTDKLLCCLTLLQKKIVTERCAHKMTRLKLRNKLLQHNNKKLYIARKKHKASTCTNTKNLDALLTSAKFLSRDFRIFVEMYEVPIHKYYTKLRHQSRASNKMPAKKYSTDDAILQNLRHNINFLI